MFRKVKNKKIKDFEPETISWQREGSEGLSTPLIHIYPQPNDKIQNKKYFAVKDYEKALFYNKGTLIDIASGGVYEIDKNARTKGTEIVWIDISFLDIPWGIPITHGIPTKEGSMIGLHGDLRLRINNAKIFYQWVIAGNKVWTRQDIKDWIMSLLHTSLRDIFKTYTANRIVFEDRERIIPQVIAKVTDEFIQYGLELVTFNVKDLKMPDNYDVLILQMNQLKERNEELLVKKNNLQDELLDGKITQEEYNEKARMIEKFINEINEDLKNSKEKLSKI